MSEPVKFDSFQTERSCQYPLSSVVNFTPKSPGGPKGTGAVKWDCCPILLHVCTAYHLWRWSKFSKNRRISTHKLVVLAFQVMEKRICSCEIPVLKQRICSLSLQRRIYQCDMFYLVVYNPFSLFFFYLLTIVNNFCMNWEMSCKGPHVSALKKMSQNPFGIFFYQECKLLSTCGNLLHDSFKT